MSRAAVGDVTGKAQIDRANGGAQTRVDFEAQRFARLARDLDVRRKVTLGREQIGGLLAQAAQQAHLLRVVGLAGGRGQIEMPIEQLAECFGCVDLDRYASAGLGERGCDAEQGRQQGNAADTQSSGGQPFNDSTD